MSLSYLSWLNGLSAIGYIIFGFTLASYFLIKGKKLKIKLLVITGLGQIFNTLTLNLEYSCDFLSVLLTGNNLNNPNGFIGVLTWIWMLPASLLLYYVAIELVMLKIKKALLSVITVLGTAFGILLLVDRGNSFTFIYPNNPGEELIKVQVDFISPLGIVAAIFGTMFTIIIFGFGTVHKAIRSKGVVRKKFLLLALGFNLFNVMQTTDAFLSTAMVSFIARIFGAIGWILVAYALREEEEEKVEKIPTKKEIKIEESIFRLSKRPDHITEEEITFHREKKICLVCKGHIGGFNFICEKCNAMYCDNCAKALATLENACWVCNSPIDISKPVVLDKEDGKKLDISLLDKSNEKLK